MSWRVEKTDNGADIVLEGFENGIADSPHKGIADMRNVNIITVPGEASVQFGTQAMTVPPTVSALAFTVVASTDVFTVASTSGWYNGMAIQFNSISGATGFSTNTVYWIGDLTSTTFKIYTNVSAAPSAVNVTADGSGTLSSYTFGIPNRTFVDYAATATSSSSGADSYVIDSNNYVWLIYGTSNVSRPNMQANTLYFMGNRGAAVAIGDKDNSVVVYHGYLIVFRGSSVDYAAVSLTTAMSWTYGWKSITPGASLHSIVGQDDAVYFCSPSFGVGSILTNAGSTFDPATSSTYTFNTQALKLPYNDSATYLAELGISLLVGGTRSYVYPWNRVAPSYSYPLILAERYTYRIVSTNTNAFIFAGNRGRIYKTNGVNVDLYKKFPDYVSGAIEPFYLIGGGGTVYQNNSLPYGDAMYWRNQLYFTYTAKKNDGSSLSTVTGVWAIDLDTNALRMSNQLSFGTSGTITALAPNITTDTPGGSGIFSAWYTGNSNGVDISSSTPYANFEPYIETELIPVGTALNPKTFAQVEYKLSYPLGNNGTSESVRIAYRTDLSQNYTTIYTTSSTTGGISAYNAVNFEKSQWLQFKISLSSNATTPTYVRLKEMRLR